MYRLPQQCEGRIFKRRRRCVLPNQNSRPKDARRHGRSQTSMCGQKVRVSELCLQRSFFLLVVWQCSINIRRQVMHFAVMWNPLMRSSTILLFSSNVLNYLDKKNRMIAMASISWYPTNVPTSQYTAHDLWHLTGSFTVLQTNAWRSTVPISNFWNACADLKFQSPSNSREPHASKWFAHDSYGTIGC